MTEHEFEAQITAALEQIDAARAGKPRRDAFNDILERFARTLSKHPAIGASIEEVPELPDGLQLRTWPKLRRDLATLMLTFARLGNALVLLGSRRRGFATPAELGAYLTQDFLQRSSFPETLEGYEESCSMPVRGFLRRGGPSEISPDDVLVRVDPAEQRILAEATPGRELSLLVHEDRRLPSTGLYESTETYSCLVSGGYGMCAFFHSRAEDGRLRIAGPAMRIDELS